MQTESVNSTKFNRYQSIVYDKRLMMESLPGEEPNPIQKLVDDFGISKFSGSLIMIIKLALNTLLCNILVGEKDGKVLALRRGSRAYSNGSFYGMKHFSRKIILCLVDAFKDEGFIEYINGYYNKENKKGVVSRVWATEKLLDTLSQYTSIPVPDCDEEEEPCRIHYLFGKKLSRVKLSRAIILKDKDKNLMRYKPTIAVQRMERFLNKYNDFITQHKITIPREAVLENTSNGSPLLVPLASKANEYIDLDCELYRVFNNGKFTLGGRFYGAEYQAFPDRLRAQILIDGERTFEKDYSACQIRMLYHKKGIEYKDDPYKIVNSDPSMRYLIKKMFHIIINAKSSKEAIEAYKYYIEHEPFISNKNELKANAWELAKTIKDKHKEIKQHFNTGIGVKLQFLDSRIAERILKHFTKKNIVCLCIHDSFIVQERYNNELIEVMKHEYKKEMGFDCVLKQQSIN